MVEQQRKANKDALEKRMDDRQTKKAWREEQRHKRQDLVETARQSDLAVATVTKQVVDLVKEHADISKNLTRLSEIHRKAIVAETLAKKIMQKANRDYEHARTKEKQARAIVAESETILYSKAIEKAKLNLQDAYNTCTQAWDVVPKHLSKDAKKGRDRLIRKMAKEALR